MSHPQHRRKERERKKNCSKQMPAPPPLLPQIPDTVREATQRGPATPSSLLDRTGYFPHRPLHGDPAGSWSNLLNPKGRRGWGGGGAGQKGPRRHPPQSGPEAEAANWNSSEKA